MPQKNMQDYQWKIIYNADEKLYYLRGYVRVNGDWDLDGAAVAYGTMNEVIQYIKDNLIITNRAGI